MSTIVENEVIEKGKRAKVASFTMNIKTTAEKNEALLAVANQLIADQAGIIEENKKDIT